MDIQEFRAQVLAERDVQRRENLAKSQAFLATLAKSIQEKEGK